MNIPAFSLEDDHVLVTGASSGIGRATAEVLSRLGARVTLGGRNLSRLTEVLAGLSGSGHAIAACDLAESDAIPDYIRQVVAASGPLHGLAHCAGIQETRAIRQFDQDFFDRVLHTNLASTLALARGVRQRGCHAANGALVFVASIAAYVGQPGNAVYAASKGGVIAATRTLAMELVRDGLRVNAVAPALVETPLSARFRSTTTTEQYEAIITRHPLGIGQPEDVAHAIAFLLSPASRWITGVVLPVDGGHLVR